MHVTQIASRRSGASSREVNGRRARERTRKQQQKKKMQAEAAALAAAVKVATRRHIFAADSPVAGAHRRQPARVAQPKCDEPGARLDRD